MSYNNGSITNADPASAFLTAIESALSAHANWDQVETFTLTNPQSIWRNNGSGASANSWGADFYIAFEKVSTTQFRVRTSEQYTPASGTPANARMIKPCRAAIGNTNTTITPNADGSFGISGGYAPNDISILGYVGYSSLVTTGFDYFIILSKDYLRVGLKQAANQCIWETGLFDTLLPGAPGPVEPFPLYQICSTNGSPVTTNHSGSGSGYGSMTRHPNLPDQTARAYLWSLDSDNSSTIVGARMGGPGNLTGISSSDRFQGAGYVPYGIPALQTNTSSDASLVGRWRGRPKDTIVVATDVSGVGIGDDWTLGSDVYVNWRIPFNSSCWVKRDVT